MNKAKAFANNDVVLLVWTYDQPIPGCLGFCIKRKNVNSSKEVTLESMVGFKKESIEKREFKPTNKWPIQKFNWRDFSAESGQTYQYTIIPMIGASDNLKEANANRHLETNIVTLSPGKGKVKAYFNRGILSTQFVSSQVPKSVLGIPNYKILLERLKQPGDQLRNSLADELRFALMNLFDKALAENGECYCALYELNDAELLEKILKAGSKVHIILSNTGPEDETNQVSRESLHKSKVDIIDRFVSSGHIGHNKFVIYVNSKGKAQTVMTGSTNWTYTGLCAQSNNSIIIDSEKLAAHYMDFWNRLKDDDSKQEIQFRNENNKQRKVTIGDTKISLWFSPNTKQKNKTANSKLPEDMKEVFEAMEGAIKSLLFLSFQPGNPSIIEKAAEIQIANPDLFIRGAATDLEAVENSNVTLFHRGIKDPVIVGALELKDDFAFWMAELLKSSPRAHAIIHDKIVVIDAFTDNCVVITGSHNLGYRASYNNDENLLIIRGDKELATSYATHILDIYDHYRWRYFLNKQKGRGSKFEGLKPEDTWQEPYFNDKRGESIDRRFWL